MASDYSYIMGGEDHNKLDRPCSAACLYDEEMYPLLEDFTHGYFLVNVDGRNLKACVFACDEQLTRRAWIKGRARDYCAIRRSDIVLTPNIVHQHIETTKCTSVRCSCSLFTFESAVIVEKYCYNTHVHVRE